MDRVQTIKAYHNHHVPVFIQHLDSEDKKLEISQVATDRVKYYTDCLAQGQYLIVIAGADDEINYLR
jgi:hypothetical protein